MQSGQPAQPGHGQMPVYSQGGTSGGQAPSAGETDSSLLAPPPARTLQSSGVSSASSVSSGAAGIANLSREPAISMPRLSLPANAQRTSAA